jgi:RNase P subunit RPR2
MRKRYEDALIAFENALRSDPSLAQAQRGRDRAQSYLDEQKAISRHVLAQTVPIGAAMKNESISKTCPRCGTEMLLDEAVVRHWRDIGLDGLRAPCSKCGTPIMINLKTGELSSDVLAPGATSAAPRRSLGGSYGSISKLNLKTGTSPQSQ